MPTKIVFLYIEFFPLVNGAKSSAAIYSIIETAKANQLEPYEYLKHLLTELPKATTAEELKDLLPWNVKLQDGVC